MIKTKTALIVIDMEDGFISENATFSIAGAKRTILNCERVINSAREKDIPVFFVKRIYRNDGSDIELTRHQKWMDGGRPMTPGSNDINGASVPRGLKPQKGDYTIIKPRWSAFFQTELDLVLRRLGINTIILIGTTTPNCIRTTAYDGNSYDYEVVVVEDCCSSQTEEIQKCNIEDMRRMGAFIINSKTFIERYNNNFIYHKINDIRDNINSSKISPEPIQDINNKYTGWTDVW